MYICKYKVSETFDLKKLKQSYKVFVIVISIPTFAPGT